MFSDQVRSIPHGASLPAPRKELTPEVFELLKTSPGHSVLTFWPIGTGPVTHADGGFDIRQEPRKLCFVSLSQSVPDCFAGSVLCAFVVTLLLHLLFGGLRWALSPLQPEGSPDVDGQHSKTGQQDEVMIQEYTGHAAQGK